jgi:hypothetical protein
VRIVKTDIGASPNRISRPSYLAADNRSYDSVIFQQSKKLLDFDLNMMQRILQEARAFMARQTWPTSGFLRAAAVTYGTPTNALNLADAALTIGGHLVRMANPANASSANIVQLTAAPSSGGARYDLLWVEVWFEEIRPNQVSEAGKSDAVYTFGGAGSGSYAAANPLIRPDGTNNELQDVTFGGETTRRIQVRWRIRVTEHAAGATPNTTYQKGLTNTAGTVANPDVLAQGGAAGPVAGKTFLRADQVAGFDFPDAGLYVAGAGSAADAGALNTVDGRVYGCPAIWLQRPQGAANVSGAQATDISDVVVSQAGGDSTVSGQLFVGTAQANAWHLIGGVSGNPGAIVAQAKTDQGDANVDLRLLGKGTGVVRVSRLLAEQDGTAAEVGIGWQSDRNTGLARLGADRVGVYAGGVLLADVQTAGVDVAGRLTATGNVGAGTVAPAYGLHAFGGGLRVQALADAPQPAVTPNATGSTAYTYYVVAVDRNGRRSLPSPARTIANGAATPNNTVSWAAVPGAATYDVLKGTTATRLGSTPTLSLNDTNQATSAYTAPVRNESADAVLDGATDFGSYLDVPLIAPPASPPATRVRVYAKADGQVYKKDSAGIESSVGGGGDESVIMSFGRAF